MAVTKTLKYLYQYYISPGFGRGKYILPTHVNFPITDNCNSKCQMCNVWKDKSDNELSPEEIASIFSNKLFRNTRHLGISGGEPTLRKDLIKCVESILISIPKLESLSITSHGFHPSKWERLLPQILNLCQSHGTNFSVNISVDGIGDLHNEVRRVENGWKKVLKTIKIVKQLGLTLQLQSTISKHNVYGINEILHYAETNNIDVVFRKATEIERLYNNKITNEFFTSNPENSFFSDFLKSSRLKSVTKNPARRLFYKDLSSRLIAKGERKAPCHFQNNGVLISAHGEMSHCSIDNVVLGNSRNQDASEIYFSEKSKNQLKSLLNNKCKGCLHDQSGSWPPWSLFKEEISSRMIFITYLTNILKFSWENTLFVFGIQPKNVILTNHEGLVSVHIIGAYGGEHVGDSAILGGVIIRLLNKMDTINEFVVYSKRVDRTKFWIKGLDFGRKVNIRCEDYNSLKQINAASRDILVWAGGPIMEMPRDLLEHYATIKAFYKANLKFEIIGCGWGPFKTKYSKRLATKILSKASYIQMRDHYNLPFSYEIDKDPAFDYLYHQANIEPKQIAWSLKKSEEFISEIKHKGFTKLFLINLRPMWSKYNKSDLTLNELHLMVKNSILEIIRSVPHNVAVVSVPFNTDHYGFSDMDLAMKINDICVKEKVTNYFIFNRELNARDTIRFLKNFDFGMCMRFHACIFLKGLNIPVFGIDYTAGEKGKVGGLFDSFHDTNYSNILKIDTDKILRFISSKT